MRTAIGRTLRFLVLVGLLAAPVATSAQSTGTVRGVISDESGAVLPGATVLIASVATGQTSETVTSAEGAYLFPFLPPGNYIITFSLPGFREEKRTVTINVASTVALDVGLKVQGLDETITVTGGVPTIQLDTSSLGHVVENVMITAVPLSSRNFTQALALSPGVTSDVPDAAALGRNSVNISAGGARPFENSVVINGLVADNPMSLGFDDAMDKTGIPVPSPDSIEEYRVQTGLYDAEYGRQAGAVVNVVTKSGTSRYSGTVFEFFRDDSLNANEFFRKRNGQPKGVLEQNQFGGTLGGPLFANRTFFFTSYQGTRQTNGVDSRAARNTFLPELGDRSRSALGALYGGRTGIFGGVAIAPDGSNINPVALEVLNARLPDGSYVVPDPQVLQGNRTGLSTFSVPAEFTEDQFVFNVDRTLSQTQRFTAKTFYSGLPSHVPFPTANVPGFGETTDSSNLLLNFSHTWTMGARTFHELRFGYNRSDMQQTPTEPLQAADIGMVPPVQEYSAAPIMAVTGLFTLGSSQNQDQRTLIESYEIANTLTMARGRHDIRLGGSLNPVLTDRFNAYLKRGRLNFNSFPDFLLGMSGAQNGTAFSNLSSTVVANGIAQRYPRFLNVAAFVQDDFRMTDRLTLNLGFRYQFNAKPWDRDGRNGGYDRRLHQGMPPPEGSFAGFTLPANADVEVPAGVTVLEHNHLFDGQDHGFSPRVGAAWRPAGGGDMVIRAGWGIFFSAIAGTVIEQAYFDPWYTQLAGGGASFPNATFQDPFAGSVPPTDAFPLFLPYSFPPTRSIFIMNPEMKQPRSQHWSVNFQRQLPGLWMVEAGYVGSKSSNLLGNTRPNQALLASPESPVNGQTTNTLQNRNSRVPYLGWAPDGISEHHSLFSSNYHSLQATLSKRYADGMTMRASYTLSRARDNVNASDTGRNQPLGGYTGDYHNIEGNWGPASFDRTHRFVVSGVWDLPFRTDRNVLFRVLANGWSISGVGTIQTGRPYSITDTRGGTIYGATSYGQFVEGKGPDDAEKSGATEDRLNQYFDTSVFTTPPVVGNGTGFGNVPRNVFRGPGQMNFDLSFRKVSRIGGLRDTAQLELRLEVFNVLNTPQFGLPGTNAAAPASFGVISNTVAGPRIMQLAAKYLF